jgi:VWFA-related protein
MQRFTRAVLLTSALAVAVGPSGRAQQPAGQTQGTQPAREGQGAPPAPGAQPATNPQDNQPPATPTDQPTPTFRAGINFVRVDVIVTDKNGSPVNNLTAADFEVTEESKPQKIETFKLIELDGGLIPTTDGPPRAIRTDADEESEAARDDVRLFGVFLDDYHVRFGSSVGARQAVSRFIETQLGPTDMIGMMYPLEPIASVRFSRNHDAVRRGIERFQGRKFDYTPKNEFEERYAYYPTEVVERIRNQVSMGAIRSLISRMGALKEGRKALMLVSEGYSNNLPPQMRNPVAALGGMGNPASRDPNAGLNDPNEFRAQAFGSFDMLNDLREIYSAASRANVAIYPIDPRGLATAEFDISDNINTQIDRSYLSATMDTLRVLAEETDGRAIVNRNDLTIAMKQIVRDSSSYYLLGYNSTLAAADGKFHEITVRVKRPGVQVRARKGYWALTREDVARATAPPKPEPPKAVEAALAAINVPTRTRLIRTWLGAGRGENGRTAMTFVWEPSPRVPGDRNPDQAARVMLTAVGPDGGPLYRGRVPAGAGTPPAAPAGPARVTFAAPPGKIQLRLSVEGAGSEVLDTETREITVPDFTTPQTAIGTPEFFRARTVRDFQALQSDPAAVQTPAREFMRTDRVLVRVPAYAAGGAPPAITVRLLNRSASPMMDLPVTAPANGLPASFEVPTSRLPAGEYLIEITAAGGGDPSDAANRVQELVGFRVAG